MPPGSQHAFWAVAIISASATTNHITTRRTCVQRPSPISITPLRGEVANRRYVTASFWYSVYHRPLRLVKSCRPFTGRLFPRPPQPPSRYPRPPPGRRRAGPAGRRRRAGAIYVGDFKQSNDRVGQYRALCSWVAIRAKKEEKSAKIARDSYNCSSGWIQQALNRR